MKMTIFWIKGGGNYGNVTDYSRCCSSCNLAVVQCGIPYHCNPEPLNDHKREIREQESAKRDLEYHEARMKVYEKTN